MLEYFFNVNPLDPTGAFALTRLVLQFFLFNFFYVFVNFISNLCNLLIRFGGVNRKCINLFQKLVFISKKKNYSKSDFFTHFLNILNMKL